MCSDVGQFMFIMKAPAQGTGKSDLFVTRQAEQTSSFPGNNHKTSCDATQRLMMCHQGTCSCCSEPMISWTASVVLQQIEADLIYSWRLWFGRELSEHSAPISWCSEITDSAMSPATWNGALSEQWGGKEFCPFKSSTFTTCSFLRPSLKALS